MSEKTDMIDPIAPGFHTLSPYITVADANEAIRFYTEAFGAKEQFRLTDPGGKIGHAEVQVGNSIFMLSDEYPDFGAVSPKHLGGSPVKLYLSVPNVDEFVPQAEQAGATVLRPLKTEFHGYRQALLACPFGYQWFASTRVEEVSVEEMQKRFSEMFG